MRDFILILGFGLILCACEEIPAESHFSVRDSAGVQIVESHAPRWGESTPWSVSDSPLLDLTHSGTGPSHEFYMVWDGTRLPDGRIVVGNDGSSEVRIYSSEGDFIASSGRKGEGPGEFRRMFSLSRMRGDSIVVYDVILNRLTILSSSGDMGRIISLRGEVERASRVRSFNDSTFLGFSRSITAPPDLGRYRRPYEIVLLGPDGRKERSLGVIPGIEGFRSATVDSPLAFGKNGHLSIQGGEYVLGTADSLAYDRYRGPGDLVQRVRVQGFDLRISQEQADSTRQAMRPPPDRPAPPDILQVYESMPIPDFKPGYSRLVMDSDGFVWAAHYPGRVHFGQSAKWEVFSPDGEWLGAVSTPPGLAVIEIGSDYILGVHQDEVDVEHVQLFGLSRAG